MSSVSSAAICEEEKALIWPVESDATSSVVQSRMAAAESSLIWLMLREETIDVMGKVLK